MGSEFDISPLREASAFGAGIDRCVVIEIVASAQEWFSGREQIDGQTSDFENPLAARRLRRSALYEFSRRTVHMAKLEEAACLPRRRQNRRKHRPKQLPDGPTAFSFHATVFNPQTRSDV